MTTKEIITLPIGTTVFLIKDAEIEAMTLLSFHPKYSDYVYFVRHGNVENIKCIFIPNSSSLRWELEYENAKKEMWKQLKKKVDTINVVYMDGKCKFKFEDE